MRQLSKYDGKEVEITFKTGLKETGIIYRYYRDPNTMRDGDYEYWFGYYSKYGVELIKPSIVKDVKVINEHPED